MGEGTRGSTRFCSDCGEPLAPGARFCAACGAKVVATVLTTTFATPSTPLGITCPFCGEPKSEPRAGCSKCGNIDMKMVNQTLPASPTYAPTVRTEKTLASSGVPNWAKALGAVVALGVLLWIAASVFSGSDLVNTAPVSANPAAAQYLDPRVLAADPKAYVGRNIYLQGQSNTIDQKGDYTWMQLMAQAQSRDYVTESIVVEVRPKNTTILKSECYRVYAVVKGTTRVKLLLTGAEQDVPVVNGYMVVPASRGELGIGCASP